MKQTLRKLIFLIMTLGIVASAVFLHFAIKGSNPAYDVPIIERAEPENVMHIIVYLSDALRPDHLSCYGYERDTSPNIDKFAEDSVVFTNAYANSSWTRPSVVTLMTGRLPSTHGVFDIADSFPDIPTLASPLKEKGYYSWGLATNINIFTEFGFGKDFDEYIDFTPPITRIIPGIARRVNWLPERWRIRAKKSYMTSDTMNSKFFTFLNERPDKPFFAYMHSMDPHDPYWPEPPYSEMFKNKTPPGKDPSLPPYIFKWINNYDGEIRFNDENFGKLIERLKELGLYEKSLIVFVSDHGEEFLEHDGVHHGFQLFEEHVRIPLIIKLPGGVGAGKKIDTRVGMVDLASTILDAAAAGPMPDTQGKSLMHLMANSDSSVERLSGIYAEEDYRDHELVSWRRDKYKLIRKVRPEEGTLLFDIEEDPGELDDISGDTPDVLEKMSREMDYFTSGMEPGYHLVFNAPARYGGREMSGRITLDSGSFNEAVSIPGQETGNLRLEDENRTLHFDIQLENTDVFGSGTAGDSRAVKRLRFIPSGESRRMLLSLNPSDNIVFSLGNEKGLPGINLQDTDIDLFDGRLPVSPAVPDEDDINMDSLTGCLYYIREMKVKEAEIDEASRKRLRELGYMK